MRTSQSTIQLVEALLLARAEFTPVLRDAIGQIGQDRHYRYADISSVIDAVMPALLKHKVLVVQAVDAETATLITRVEHITGEWIESTYPLKLDLQPQQLGASLTYGRRYSLQSLLCLAAEDDDGATAHAAPTKAPAKTKAKGGEAISQAQRKRLFAIATGAGWSTEQMKDYLRTHYGIESSKDLTASIYDQVCEDFDRPPVAPTEMPF